MSTTAHHPKAAAEDLRSAKIAAFETELRASVILAKAAILNCGPLPDDLDGESQSLPKLVERAERALVTIADVDLVHLNRLRLLKDLILAAVTRSVIDKCGFGSLDLPALVRMEISVSPYNAV